MYFTFHNGAKGTSWMLYLINTLLIHELIMTRGMDNSDCVYQGFMPTSNPGLVETPIKTHGPQMAEVLFPKGNLGGNYQHKKE